MKQVGKVFHILLIMSSIIVGTLSMLVFSLPYDIFKKIGNSLSPDGNFQRLTPSLAQHLKNPALIIAIVFLLLGSLLWIKWKVTHHWIERGYFALRSWGLRLIQDFADFIARYMGRSSQTIRSFDFRVDCDSGDNSQVYANQATD